MNQSTTRQNMTLSRVIRETWDACVTCMAAPDTQTAIRWRSDHAAYLSEGFRVRELPESMMYLVEASREIAERWTLELEKRVGRPVDEFDAWFSDKIRVTDWQKTSDHEMVALGFALYGLVINLDMVNHFAWVLPMATPCYRQQAATIGKRMAAVFFLEKCATEIPIFNTLTTTNFCPSSNIIISIYMATYAT